ncbi:hypothetical protein, partial [Sellimonas sp.]|uniref:hypothetical protein n=1 Tax=Sellimonas sp. TaxID=2021466 RepID=UPI002ED2D7F8
EDAMCTLVKPDERYTAQIEAFKQEMLEAGSSMDGTGSLRQNDPLEWIKENRLYEKKGECPGKLGFCDAVCLCKAAGSEDPRHDPDPALL